MGTSMKRARTWSELYSFPGFRAAAQLKGVFGDPDVRVVRLRRKKDQHLFVLWSDALPGL
jgi:hypothetical protein